MQYIVYCGPQSPGFGGPKSPITSPANSTGLCEVHAQQAAKVWFFANSFKTTFI